MYLCKLKTCNCDDNVSLVVIFLVQLWKTIYEFVCERDTTESLVVALMTLILVGD